MSISYNILAWIDTPETIALALQGEVGSMEQFEEAVKLYEGFTAKLDSEWKSERIRDFLIAKKREQYQQTARLIKKLELDNRDARTKGVSFMKRKVYTDKIAIGYRLVIDLQKEAHQMKRTNYRASNMVCPLDFPFIEKEGFEKYLELYYV